MPIVNSQIKSESQQIDGRWLVHEQHTDANGVIYDHIYHAETNTDATFRMSVCQLRGQNIGAELDSRQAAIVQATNFEIPLAPLDIMRRLSPSEWAAFQTSTDQTVEYFRAVFAKTTLVYRTDPLTVAGFDALITLGVLTAERVAEILA